MNAYKNQILEVLRQADRPMDVNKIREAAGIGNWNTALKHLLELMLQGVIVGQKTSKSWVFWIDKQEGGN